MESIDENFSNGSFGMNEGAVNNLKLTAKWANFVSIVGFVILGLMLLGAMSLLLGNGRSAFSRSSNVDPEVAAVIYIAMIAIQFFPVYYMFKFASKMTQSLEAKETVTFEEATKFMKLHYQFIGVLTIIGISLFVLLFLIGLFAGR